MIRARCGPQRSSGIGTRRLLFVTVLVSALLLTSPAFGWPGYAYNYAFDWSNSPFNDNDYIQHATEAAYWQGKDGYSTRALNRGWAYQVYNNMAASSMRIFHMSGHAGTGRFVCWDPETRYWDGLKSNISCVRADTTHYGGTHSINGASQPCNHFRRLDQLTGSNIRIMIFRGCYTGRGGSGSLVYDAVTQSDMDFSGGFYSKVWSFISSGRVPGAYWENGYWSSLYLNYYAGYSMQRARDRVWSAYSNYYGYDQIVTCGDQNVRM